MGGEIDPVMLERLRRGVPLRMTAMGRLLFGGEPITHPRVDAALRAGLDVTDAGEPTVHIGGHWCYLGIDDLPLRATAARPIAGGVELRLDDGRTAPLDPATLWEEPGRGLRCTVPSAGSGRPLGVRLTNRAQIDLQALVQSDADGRPMLRIGEAWHRVPDTAPGEP
jgi:uncharacterized protein